MRRDGRLAVMDRKTQRPLRQVLPDEEAPEPELVIEPFLTRRSDQRPGCRSSCHFLQSASIAIWNYRHARSDYA